MFKNRKMNRTTAFLLAGLTLLVVSALFLVPKVAAASCFTDTSGHWAESFICWMKTKGYSSGYADGTFRPNNMISRAEVSVFMQKLLSTGDTYINTGPSGWVANATYSPPAYVDQYWAWTNLKSTSTGTYMYSMSPSIPSSLHNTKMYLKGIKICVHAGDSPNAYVTGLDIYHVYYNNGNSNGYTVWNQINSTADLTTTGCYVYTFTSPASFWGTDQLTVNLWGTINNTAYAVRVGQVTAILAPSAEVAVLGDDMLGPLERNGDPLALENDPSSGLP